MASMTNAQMRALAQVLVRDTSTVTPALQSSEWTQLLNDAMFVFAEVFPEECVAAQNVVTSSGTYSLSLPASPLRSIEYIERATGSAFVPMEKVARTDIVRRISDESASPVTGIPKRFAAWRNNADATWSLLVHPTPDDIYTLAVYGLRQPTALSADSDTTPYQDGSCRTIARLAAVEAARVIGRPQAFVDGLAQRLPQQIQAHYADIVRLESPRAYKGKAVA